MLLGLKLHLAVHFCRVRAEERGHGASVSPQRCHSVTQFVYDSTEQQRDEEVPQLAGGEVDAGNLEEEENHREEKQIFKVSKVDTMTSKQLPGNS